MADEGKMPKSNYEGYKAMYTGKPSKPGKTHDQYGYGLVEGDGVGYEDNADSTFAGRGEWGLSKGKRRLTPSRKEQS